LLSYIKELLSLNFILMEIVKHKDKIHYVS
jgi:hypothetical protein